MHLLARSSHNLVSISARDWWASESASNAMQIPHLKELGVTAVELLPVFEFDELEFQRIPNPRDHMVNIWGYAHASFFAPMSRFAADGAGPVAAARQFKELVRQLHAAGIEVILDVVYNHTIEGQPALFEPLWYFRPRFTNALAVLPTFMV